MIQELEPKLAFKDELNSYRRWRAGTILEFPDLNNFHFLLHHVNTSEHTCSDRPHDATLQESASQEVLPKESNKEKQ